MAEQKLKGSIPSGGLEGMAVLVTGGGTGIGAACASRLAADGAAVTICGRTESKLEDAAKKIQAIGTIMIAVAIRIRAICKPRLNWRFCFPVID